MDSLEEEEKMLDAAREKFAQWHWRIGYFGPGELEAIRSMVMLATELRIRREQAGSHFYTGHISGTTDA